MYGADPRLAELGSKTGCRRMFEEPGVPCPVGAEDLHSVDDIVAGIRDMRTCRPTLTEAIVKLNEGVSGAGNAVVDLHDLPAPGSSTESEEIRARVLAMELEADDLDPRRLPGGVRRARRHRRGAITGTALTSPSVQMRALPDGRELLSTHDQLLGGASGQRYLGCVPRGRRVRRGDRRTRHGGRTSPRAARRDRPVRGGLRRRPGRGGHLDAVRHRAEPPQGRHHPPLPHPAVPDRRQLRRRPRACTSPPAATGSTSSRPTISRTTGCAC